jgi:hypothetical protein
VTTALVVKRRKLDNFGNAIIGTTNPTSLGCVSQVTSMRLPHVLDKENGNTLRGDAVGKEMKKVRVAFDIKEGDEKAPVGCQEIGCHHGIFDSQ